MTLDEAIKHSYEQSVSASCFSCRQEHLQLARWLEELKEYRRRQTMAFKEDENKIPIIRFQVNTRIDASFLASLSDAAQANYEEYIRGWLVGQIAKGLGAEGLLIIDRVASPLGIDYEAHVDILSEVRPKDEDTSQKG